MPIKWTPELDSILLHAVFEECNISFSKALCNKIADRVKAAGIECTPKAVENRLYTWKKKNVGGTAPSTTSTPSKPASVKKTATPAKAPRTPKSSGKKKMVTPEPEPELEDDDEEMFADSPSMRKRGVESDEEEEDENEKMGKKIKTEIVEEGEGLCGFKV